MSKNDSNYVIAASKAWLPHMDERLSRAINAKFYLIEDREALTLDFLERIKPRQIFFPHWSYLIPEEIFNRFECIIFHMTDLPFGRGGSPLQNLIVRGIYQTKISAIRCVAELDAGPIYLQESLLLDGPAREIYRRASESIEKMIEAIILTNPIPKPQTGPVTLFKRRKPSESSLLACVNLTHVYDYIRMLDADGYPPAFIDFGPFRIELTNAQQEGERVSAQAKITVLGSMD